ncbi:serine hydrolase domain-containing protein [Variovorax boronicumulans]|uniref:serine hydrolase domain-containing protein n=1 Tax=Variovorax boronicumulans TaxID=436515 RepID=UPI0015876967|nr:serine hydrolase [Variovorax boronicumulans]
MAGLPRSLLPGVLRTALSAVLLLCAAHAVPAAGVFPAAQWATPSAAEPSHWSEAKLKVADAFAASIKSDAYLVIDKGVLVHAYGDIDKPMNLASVRKSVQSVLYGIHVGRGEIDLDQTLGQLGIGDKDGLSDTERTATVRQLLQLRSGVYHPAAYETAQAKAERPARGSHAPGEFWYYNNWDANVLGTIFERRTGRSVFEALKTDLAEPLQFQDFRYPQDTESRLERSSEHPAQVMHLSARDLARIGLLMARRHVARQAHRPGRLGDRKHHLVHDRRTRLERLWLSVVGAAQGLSVLAARAQSAAPGRGRRRPVHDGRSQARPRRGAPCRQQQGLAATQRGPHRPVRRARGTHPRGCTGARTCGRHPSLNPEGKMRLP